MSSAIYQEIKASCDLPSPTGVALQIIQLTNKEDTSNEELAKVIATDPALSSRLMKIVNSPLAGLSRQILSIPRAVAMLGTNTIASLALSFSLVSNHRKGRCSNFDYELFWSESLACGVAARHLAIRLRKFAPDESFTCGLLNPIGRLALATAFPTEYAAVLESFAMDLAIVDGKDCQTLGNLERLAFAIDHVELAAEMMQDWRIPTIFCDAVRQQTGPFTEGDHLTDRTILMARILHIGTFIARVLTQPTIYRDTLNALVQSATELGIGDGVHDDMFNSIAAEWQEAGAILDVKTMHVPPLTELYTLAKERRDEIQNRPPQNDPEPETTYARG